MDCFLITPSPHPGSNVHHEWGMVHPSPCPLTRDSVPPMRRALPAYFNPLVGSLCRLALAPKYTGHGLPVEINWAAVEVAEVKSQRLYFTIQSRDDHTRYFFWFHQSKKK